MEHTRRLTIAIGQDAAVRLNDLARAERRDPREQAALLLEKALARRAKPKSGTVVGELDGAAASREHESDRMATVR